MAETCGQRHLLYAGLKTPYRASFELEGVLMPSGIMCVVSRPPKWGRHRFPGQSVKSPRHGS